MTSEALTITDSSPAWAVLASTAQLKHTTARSCRKYFIVVPLMLSERGEALRFSYLSTPVMTTPRMKKRCAKKKISSGSTIANKDVA